MCVCARVCVRVCVHTHIHVHINTGHTLASETETDEMTCAASVALKAGLTRARVLDWDAGSFVNLQADVHFPESPGIVQIEEFGMHISADGLVLTGVKLEAIMERRADHVSLDDLARVATDIYSDSASIIQDLLTPIQKQMMQVAYSGDALNRAPYTLLIAAAMTPKLPAAHYRVRGSLTYELSQILGTVEEVVEIGRLDMLIKGSNACLLVGPHAHVLEPLMLEWLKLHALLLFADEVYWRALQLSHELQHVSNLITFGGRGQPTDTHGDGGKERGQGGEGASVEVGRERELAHKASHDYLRLQLLQRQMTRSLEEELHLTHKEGVWRVDPEKLGDTPEEMELVQCLVAYLDTSAKRSAAVAQVGRDGEQTYMHTQTQTHTQTHTYTHTHMHTHLCIYRSIYIHICIYIGWDVGRSNPHRLTHTSILLHKHIGWEVGRCNQIKQT